MKACIRRQYGPPSQIEIESTKEPVLKEEEVLVKVHATTVNRTDCANLTAIPFIMRFVLGLFKPKNIVLGTDFSGEVLSVGKNVQSIQINDKVFGFNDLGSKSQATQTAIHQKHVFAIPANIDFKHAAASLEGAHYAYTFIHKTKIQTGNKILIIGASGAIGSALLQFVKQYDVTVAATCNTKNLELIQSLGADKVFDYTKEDFAQDNVRYDFIFDAVGKSTYGICKPLLHKKGIYISSELGPYAQNLFFALSTKFTKKKVLFPVPFSTQQTIPYISRLLETGGFKPVIDKTYPLEQIAEAYEYVHAGKKTGNVVVAI